jgi:predicted dehydrogenase
MSESEIGVGVIGFGWMGKVHTYAYQSIPMYYRPAPLRTRLVGVAVRRAEMIGPAVEQGGFSMGTSDWRELVARDDIGIINVCTPNDLHKEQVIAAIEAGKHVYCDKPLAVNYEQCQEIVGALRRSTKKLVTQVALQYRFYPATMRAKQIVDEGRLGTIRSFRACYLHASLVDSWKPAGWRLAEGKAGGTLADMGSHLIDLLTWLIGPVQGVNCDCRTFTRERATPTGQSIKVSADEWSAMLVRMRSGASGTIEVSKVATGAQDELRIEIHGEAGALRINLADPNAIEFYDQREADEPIGGDRGWKRIQTIGNYPPPAANLMPGKLGIGWITGHIACLHNFLAAVAGQGAAHPTFEESAELQRVIDAGYRSNERREWERV